MHCSAHTRKKRAEGQGRLVDQEKDSNVNKCARRRAHSMRSGINYRGLRGWGSGSLLPSPIDSPDDRVCALEDQSLLHSIQSAHLVPWNTGLSVNKAVIWPVSCAIDMEILSLTLTLP